jgi:hypothetical protein
VLEYINLRNSRHKKNKRLVRSLGGLRQYARSASSKKTKLFSLLGENKRNDSQQKR